MLNPQQDKAVKYKNGYAFVTSVPGSGKTRVLTERTVELINSGVDPRNILCITFTNKAAKEMRERISNRLGDETASKIWISTFHAMGAKILRTEVKKVPNYDKHFTVIDSDDQKTIVEKGADELGYLVQSKKNKNGIDARKVLNAIGRKKDLLQRDGEFMEEVEEEVYEIYQYYKQYLLKANCMDFGDLLYILYLVFKHKHSVRKKYANRFKFIMVDECQDLNFCQYEICKQLASVHHNLMLIGDCDQSIYRFRQADPKHVMGYVGEKEVDVLPLSYNYRSTKSILRAAEAVIKRNSGRVAESLETTNSDGEFVKLVNFDYYTREAEWVSEEIESLIDSGYKPSDIAILYRVNAWSRDFEQALRMKGINCKVIGGKSFFDLSVVKTCIHYLQFYSNPNNSLSFHKVINKPRRSIANEMVNRIEDYCFENECSVIEALENIDEIDIKSFGKKRKHEIHKFYEALRQREDDEDLPISQLAERIYTESGLYDYFEDMAKDGSKQGRSSSLEIYDSFMTMLREWDKKKNPSIEKFLEFINLQTTNDEVDSSESVKMMTMHTSKGLEYPVVFVVGVEEDNIPHKFSLETNQLEDLEEERRLFYVGMTRAQDLLYITNARKRMRWGSTILCNPSRFIQEMKTSGAVMTARY
jgi:DNA helicase-2/ATP-dependent DNA helicase PcrA